MPRGAISALYARQKCDRILYLHCAETGRVSQLRGSEHTFYILRGAVIFCRCAVVFGQSWVGKPTGRYLRVPSASALFMRGRRVGILKRRGHHSAAGDVRRAEDFCIPGEISVSPERNFCLTLRESSYPSRRFVSAPADFLRFPHSRTRRRSKGTAGARQDCCRR